MTKLELVPTIKELDIELQKKLADLLSNRRSRNTLKQYESTWRKWCTWTAQNGLQKFPASARDIVTYLIESSERGDSKSTIAMFMTVQRLSHKGRADDPCNHIVVQEALKSINRKDKRPIKKAEMISLSELKLLCDGIFQDLTYPARAYRDRALLALGWAGALRASELVSLIWSDVRLTNEGYEITIRTSKTDQEGKGSFIGIPYYSNEHRLICPVRALQHIKSRDDSSYIFRRLHREGPGEPLSTRAVTRIIQRAASLAGLPAHYSAHSLRRGLATWAASQGVKDRDIMRHGRWLSRSVLDGYIQQGTIWQDNLLKNLLGEHD